MSFVGDWNLGGDAASANGALKNVRDFLEAYFSGDMKDDTAVAKLAEAILQGYRETDLKNPSSSVRPYKEDVSGQCNGTNKTFTTTVSIYANETVAYLNGIRWANGFTVTGANSFTFEPYGAGTACYAADTVVVEGTSVISDQDGQLWFDDAKNSGHMVTIGL